MCGGGGVCGGVCVCLCVGGWRVWGCMGVGVFVCACACLGHINTNAPLILKLWDYYFFFALDKPHNGNSWDISRGLNLFDPIIPLCYAQDHLGVQRSLLPQIIPQNSPLCVLPVKKK